MTDQTMTWTTVQQHQGLDDWRMLYDKLHARFRTGDFDTGLRLVNQIGVAAEAANHHPDIVLTYSSVRVTLSSHDAGGVTSRDVDLARQISQLAAACGAAPETDRLQVLELALDTDDLDAVRPFWEAVLGMSMEGRADDIVDLDGSLPTMWFQEAAPSDAPEQRFHLDIRVPRDVAEDRLAAAVAAGGTLVSDDEAPAFWVLADSRGNKVCICTGEARD